MSKNKLSNIIEELEHLLISFGEDKEAFEFFEQEDNLRKAYDNYGCLKRALEELNQIKSYNE